VVVWGGGWVDAGHRRRSLSRTLPLQSPVQIILRWSIERGVPALVRTADPAHAGEAAGAAAGAWALPPGGREALDRLETRARSWRPDAAWPDPEDGGVTKPSLVLPE
jgi:diketogulonate reductase-like aldo/keto reductase